MMLKTSSRKINPFGKMIGFTLRKNTGIIVILCIAALLYCPGSYLVDFESLYQSYALGLSSAPQEILLETFACIVTVIAAIVAIGFNIINLSFMYKKSSSDVFHAFPLTRTELLISRVLSGLIATAIPVAVCYASYGIMIAFNSWMGSFAQLFYYLLHTVTIVLVCSSFSLIFIVSAGSAFDLGVSLIGANIALLAIGSIFDNILYETLIGYDDYISSDIMYNISPPYFCGIGLSRAYGVVKYGVYSKSIEFLIRSVIYIAVFTVAAILLYNHRKAEKGGQAYAYRFMYLFCSLLAGVCGGYLVGMMFDDDMSSVAFWIFMIIGAILTSVVYGVVTNRGFKGVGRSVIMGGIASAVIIAVAVVGITGGFGYTKRVPEKTDINEVYINAFRESICFTDPQEVLDLHNAIIERDATDIDDTTSYQQRTTVSFNYNLKNGKTMSREFTVVSADVQQELLAIYKSEQRIKMIKEELPLDKATQTSLWFNYYENYYSVSLTNTEAQAFLDAYWQDVQNCGTEIFDKYVDNYTYEISGYVKSDDRYFNFVLEGFDHFTNTKQFIEEHNLAERAKAEE